MILQDCSSCGIYTLGGKFHSAARVEHDDRTVKLYFNDYNHLDVRSDFVVRFFDNKEGELHIHCQLVVRRNPDFPRVPEPWMADCRLQHLLRTIKPERDAKASVSFEAIFKMSGNVTFYATIREINAAGMYITTFQPMNKNQYIQFPNQFKTGSPDIEAVAQKARRLEDGSFGYECKFVNLSHETESAIQDFVNRNLNNRSMRKS